MVVGAFRTNIRPPLSAYVESMWVSDSYTQPHARERLLPTGRMNLIIDLSDGGPDIASISGARTSFMVLDTSKPINVIAVHFKPGGGFPFFGPPAGELQELNLPLDAFWGRGVALLREQLLEAKTPKAKLDLMECALIQRLREAVPHPAVRHAVRALESEVCASSMAELTEEVGLSQRRFIELFSNQVGLTPKRFQRLARFTKALSTIESTEDVDWADLAVACGYFDQAHFIHDFRAFSGVTPSSYIVDRTATGHVRMTD